MGKKLRKNGEKLFKIFKIYDIIALNSFLNSLNEIFAPLCGVLPL
jgi:hypothetical protein